MTKSSSPCFTIWLSTTLSASIVPLTCGTTLMMSAITIASSVCGFRTMRCTTKIPSRMVAPTRMGTTKRSGPRRGSATSAPEQEQPGREHQEEGEARVGDCCGPQEGGRIRRDEHLPDDQGEDQADHDADQPGGKERPQDGDG